MPATRPQRVHWAGAAFAFTMAILLWMVWSQRLYAWTGTAGGGAEVREFGLVRYLTITRHVVGGLGGRQTVISSTWDWHGSGIAINLTISAALAIIVWFACWRMVRRDRLVGRCDECGYDLTGLRSSRCPECGAAVR